MRGLIVRKAVPADARKVNALLSEWFDWKPKPGRLAAVFRSIRSGELIVAHRDTEVIGFIHYVIHEDIIDGGPNSFISAFYVAPAYRDRGVGSLLLDKAISDSHSRGAIGIETSTIHSRAKRFYEKHQFRQTFGDMGEVFLELDADKYMKTKRGQRVKEGAQRSSCRQLSS